MSILTFSSGILGKVSKLGISGDFNLYQDTDPKRTEDIFKSWVLYHCPSGIKTPAHSSDLSSIEHVLDYLQQNLHEHQISKKQDLRKYLVEEWTKIDRSFCKKVIQFMPNKLREVIKKQGWPNKILIQPSPWTQRTVRRFSFVSNAQNSFPTISEICIPEEKGTCA
ncbi:transposable element Tcb1 transposase [Trichonephila clavipes]|nr:transposable element Tcb1 transposase [Trichonephila clavipes]